MAFGDVVEVIESSAGTASTITATFVSQTPAAGDLVLALHFTGASTSNVDTAGFTEDLLLTNATESDEGAVYRKVAAGSGDNTCTCSANVADEQMLQLLLVRGGFNSSPKDLSGSTGRTAANPAATGASGGSTAQASEFAVAIWCLRNTTNQTDAWTRQGTATPTSAMTETTVTGGNTASAAKSLEGAYQVLTGMGTFGVTRANSAANVVMLGYVTYKAAAASGAMSGSSSLTFSTSAALGGSGTLSGASSVTFSPVGALAASGALSGQSNLVFTVAGAVQGPGALSGSSSLTFGVSGAISGNPQISGFSSLTFTVSGSLAATGALSGSCSFSFSASGSMALPVSDERHAMRWGKYLKDERRIARERAVNRRLQKLARPRI